MLPAGQTLIAGTNARAVDYLVAGPGRSPKWALYAFARGRCNLTSARALQRLRGGNKPSLNCRMGEAGGLAVPLTGPGPSVNGHLAFFSDAYLAWEYARGSWALLNGPGMRAHTRRLVQVADGIRFGAASEPPVRFPIQLTGLSPALRVRSVHYVADAGVLRAKEFTLAGAGVWAPAFTTGLATPNSSCYFYPGQSRHRRINGYEVMVNHFKARPSVPAEQQVCAADADGLSEFISTFGRDHGFPNAVAVFAHHLKLLGTSPANWTTRPLG